MVQLLISLPVTIAISPSRGGRRTVASGLSDLTELASQGHFSLTSFTVPFADLTFILLASELLLFLCPLCLGQQPKEALILGGGAIPVGRAFVPAVPSGSGWRGPGAELRDP